jgi:hypothetical protein
MGGQRTSMCAFISVAKFSGPDLLWIRLGEERRVFAKPTRKFESPLLRHLGNVGRDFPLGSEDGSEKLANLPGVGD